jgi:MFS family permease
MWGMIVGSCAYTYSIFFFTTWLPTYLTEYRHFSLARMGFLAGLPLVAGMLGNVVGVLTDRILVATGRLNLARKIVIIPALVASAAAIIPAQPWRSRWSRCSDFPASCFFFEMVNGPWLAWARTKPPCSLSRQLRAVGCTTEG